MLINILRWELMTKTSSVIESNPCVQLDHYEQCGHFVNAFKVIGKKWNGLIISSLCNEHAMRFKDLSKAVNACSDRVLVERLKELEQEQIVVRTVENNLISYSLTQKGAELKPVLALLHDWADKWA